MKKTYGSLLIVASLGIILLPSLVSAQSQTEFKERDRVGNSARILRYFPLTAVTVGLKQGAEYPKPDFSEMEKSYEIVKYEYNFVGMNNGIPLFVLTVKKKVENAPPYFTIGWFDGDGVRVGINSILLPVQGTIEAMPVGEPFRLRAYAPDKKDLKRVVIVVKEKM